MSQNENFYNQYYNKLDTFDLEEYLYLKFYGTGASNRESRGAKPKSQRNLSDDMKIDGFIMTKGYKREEKARAALERELKSRKSKRKDSKNLNFNIDNEYRWIFHNFNQYVDPVF